jgi:hypothetical protein
VADLAGLLKRESTPQRFVSDLVETARSDALGELGAVVARARAVVVADQVKGMIRDVDKVVRAATEQREALRVEVAELREQGVRARAELDLARMQADRARAGLGGDLPDVTAVEDQVKSLEREWGETRAQLTAASNRLLTAERQKAVLGDLLARLEAVPVPDGDLLAVLGDALR